MYKQVETHQIQGISQNLEEESFIMASGHLCDKPQAWDREGNNPSCTVLDNPQTGRDNYSTSLTLQIMMFA